MQSTNLNKKEILKMFNSTSWWKQMPVERQQRVLNYIKEFREVTQRIELAQWLVRVIHRAMIFFSNDDSSMKKANRLIKQGYKISRVLSDLTFFLDGRNASQFLPVYRNINAAIANRNDIITIEGESTPIRAGNVIQRVLNSIKVIDPDTGMDLETSVVYDKLNEVLSSVNNVNELKEGNVFLQVDDNMHWTILDSGRCEIEGRFMKHCGNVGAKSGDRIISLRVLQGIARVPRLTFIYNNKTLGEMKGFANEKPSKAYHPAIVKLLSNTTVQINLLSGYGYKPANNFSINDLNKDLFLALAQKRPDLISRQSKQDSGIDNWQKLDEEHLNWLAELNK